MEQMIPAITVKAKDILKGETYNNNFPSDLSRIESWDQKIDFTLIDQSWVEDHLKQQNNYNFFESFLALFLLFVLSPFLLLVGILIYLDSPGNIIFKQKRVGLSGRQFYIYKLRSMIPNAEEQTGVVWAQKNDHRITRLGFWLRKLRIDELPQLINVVKGDMRLIGPRPERPEFVELLAKSIPFYQERHRVKPGITGWAQVKYSYGASINDSAEKLTYDLFYIKNQSLGLDFQILLMTLWVVIKGKGR